MACGALGFNDAGLVFLGAGIFSWLSLEPVILQRLRSHGELPAAMRTSLGIQLAPALVACSAWLSVNGGEADTFAKLLFGYGLLQLLFMLRLMPWYLRQPFNASFWSFSFGISALATTGLHLGQAKADGFFHHLALPLFIFSNLVIGLLLLRDPETGELHAVSYYWARPDVLEYTVVGTSHPMPGVPDKVTGKTQWTGDIRLPGMLPAGTSARTQQWLAQIQ